MKSSQNLTSLRQVLEIELLLPNNFFALKIAGFVTKHAYLGINNNGR